MGQQVGREDWLDGAARGARARARARVRVREEGHEGTGRGA